MYYAFCLEIVIINYGIVFIHRMYLTGFKVFSSLMELTLMQYSSTTVRACTGVEMLSLAGNLVITIALIHTVAGLMLKTSAV